MRIAVVGAGYIGAVLSAVLADKGFSVTAIDVNSKLIEIYEKGSSPFKEPGLEELIKKVVSEGNLTASTDISKISDADVILITVGTPLSKDGSADKSAIKSAVNSMKPFIKDDQLIILKSTVPPFTTENDVAKPLRKFAKVQVAFCPERLAEGNAINECKKIPVVVGGIDEESSIKAENFWKESLEIDCIRLQNAESAELVKLADNAWIDLNISLAFELAKVADNMKVDVLPIIKAVNSLPKGDSFVNVLLPSIGVGGYCLTKDPYFLDAFAKKYNSSFKTAITSRLVNEESPLYAARRLNEALSIQYPESDKEKIQIGILGLSFKNNTGDCRNTPTLPAIKELLNIGYKLKVFDPYVNNQDFQKFNNIERVFSINEVISNSNAIAFFAGHKEFHNITIKDLKESLIPGAVIFDGRMYFSEEKILLFEEAGFVFKGIGR